MSANGFARGESRWPKDRLAPRPRRVRDEHLAAVLRGEEFLLFDGAMGTQLQARGLAAGELPELLCLTNPSEIREVHAAYVAAGAEVVTTNTFGANSAKLGDAASVGEVLSAAVSCARESGARYVAADLGPTGQLLEPMGPLPFDDAYDLFAEQVRAADAAGADLFVIETMADLAEAKAALLAVRENSDLPAFVTMTFGEDGRTFLGTTPEAAAVTLSSLGADVVGINCGLGPAAVAPLVERMLPWTSCPVMAQANAGLPHVVDGVTTYDVGPEEYAGAVAEMLDAGVTVIGGCCGTTPAHIAREHGLLAGRMPAARHVRDSFAVSSAQEVCSLDYGQVGVIGERINPTGKRLMKEALRSGDHDYVMNMAIEQGRAGAQILDVNAGLPEIDERAVMCQLVSELQGVSTLPLQIDAADPAVIEAAVRSYPGQGADQLNQRQGPDHGRRAAHCEALRLRGGGAHPGRGWHPRHGGGSSLHCSKDCARVRAARHSAPRRGHRLPHHGCLNRPDPAPGHSRRHTPGQAGAAWRSHRVGREQHQLWPALQAACERDLPCRGLLGRS